MSAERFSCRLCKGKTWGGKENSLETFRNLYDKSLAMKILLLVPIICISFFSMAQTRIAARAGINLASINFKDFKTEKRLLTRLNAGLMIDIPLEENWSIYTGLYYAGKGVIYGRRFTANIVDSVTIRLNYIELPINIAYKFTSQNKNRFAIAAGPYIGYGFNGEIFTINSNQPPDKHLHKKETDKYKRLEVGYNLTSLYEINNKWGLRIDYSKSLLTINRYNKERNSVFGFSLFWYLNNKKEKAE